MKRIRGVHVWFLLSVAAALAVPLLLRAEPDGFESLGRRIQAMSQPERARIDRNFRTFLAMDEAERNHYREMHRRLEEDVDQAQGVYAGQFANYTAWLRTIEPHRREELRRTTDSRQRLELMHRIVEEQSDAEMEEITRLVNLDVRGRPLLRWLRGRSELVLLDAAEYELLMRSIESRVELSVSQREELETLEGIDRTFRLFELLQERETWLIRALDNAEVARIVGEAGLESLIESLPDEFKEQTPELDAQRRFVLMTVLFTNVRKEYRIAVYQRQPHEDDLKAFLEGLGDDDRDALLRLPPDEFQRGLAERYAEEVEDLNFEVVRQGMFGRSERPDGRPRLRDGRPALQSDAGARREGPPRGLGPPLGRPQRPRDDSLRDPPGELE